MIEQINNAGMQSTYQPINSVVQNVSSGNTYAGSVQAREVYVTNGDEYLNIGYNELTDEEIGNVVKDLNSQLSKLNTNLKFDYHAKLKQVMISIVDSTTNEVIKEIPPKKILDMCAAMMENAGLLMDKRG